jgi:hypothetical protein
MRLFGLPTDKIQPIAIIKCRAEVVLQSGQIIAIKEKEENCPGIYAGGNKEKETASAKEDIFR